MVRARLILSLSLLACANAGPADGASTTGGGETPPPPATQAATERVCFTGTVDNGVCHVFSAAREPLSAVAAHCRATGGQWLETCPTEGRIGTCTGAEGDRADYYGLGLGPDAARQACEADGHVFTP